MKNVSFNVEGMSCGGCVKHVTEALRRVGGVDVKRVSVGSAEVDYDATKTSPESITAALSAAGYPAKLAAQATERGDCGGGACCAG